MAKNTRVFEVSGKSNADKEKNIQKMTEISSQFSGFNPSILDVIYEYADLSRAILFSPPKSNKTILASIKTSYELGTRYYQENNLERAEQEFVKTLRPALSKPVMRLLHPDNIPLVKIELLDSMYHLGQIYLRNNSYPEHHAKAAAIFQYCAGFATKYGTGNTEYFLSQAYQVEKQFLSGILSINHGDVLEEKEDQDDAYHKNYYRQMLSYKGQLNTIRKEIKSSLHDIRDLTLQDIAKHSAAVEEIYKISSNFFVSYESSKQGLLQQLLADCHVELGTVPCEYAVISLGSLSLGTMTPWSDLEFAILINEGEEEYREYFRNLTKLLHIKIINLGETHLRSVGIESLNNFRTDKAEDEWFWDDVIICGFNFDSSRWNASKTPLGRQGYQHIGKPNYELIMTVEEMAEFQKEAAVDGHRWYSSDKHLVQALRSVSLIYGSQILLDQYRELLKTTIDLDILRTRSLDILQEDISKFSLKLGGDEEGKLMNVKQDIYRLGDRIINALSNYYGITANTGIPSINVWQMIDVMYELGILHKKGVQHLKEGVGIATELRLHTYLINDSQTEGISTYTPVYEHLSDIQQQELQGTFYIKDSNSISRLYHFYYVMLRLQKIIQVFSSQDSQDTFETLLQNDTLYDDRNYYKGMVHARFLEYKKALSYLEYASIEEAQNIQNLEVVLHNLFQLYIKTGEFRLALELANTIKSKFFTNLEGHIDLSIIARNYDNLGCAYKLNENYNEAIACHMEALSLYDRLSHLKNMSQDKAKCIDSLASIYCAKGEYNRALIGHHKALKYFTKNSLYEASALCYWNLGTLYSTMDYYQEAIEYHSQSLSTMIQIYSDRPNHPRIAKTYNSIASTYRKKGEYDLAIKYFKISLKIKELIYSTIPDHTDIARTYHNLGNLYTNLGKYEKALGCHDKALKIFLKHKEYHSEEIINSYTNMGNLFNKRGEYKQAIIYLERGLETISHIHQSNLNLLSRALILNNLGISCYRLKDFNKALSYQNQALEIRQIALAGIENHSEIAESLVNLGNIHRANKNYEKALDCQQKALKIREELYKDNPNHPELAASFNNLGNIFMNIEELDVALFYHNKALNIRKIIFHNNLHHPDIVGNYYNLGIVFYKKEEFSEAINYHIIALNHSVKEHPLHKIIYQNLINVIISFSINYSFDPQHMVNIIFDCAQKKYDFTDYKLHYEQAQLLSKKGQEMLLAKSIEEYKLALIFTPKEALEISDQLLDKLVQLTQEKPENITLWLSLARNDLAKVETLLKAGSNPDYAAFVYSTPLIQVISKNNIELVKILINARADINKSDPNGASPLYFSLGFTGQPINLKIVEFLLDNNANPNQPMNDGDTPMHMAHYRGNIEAIRLLLKHGAELNAVNEEGKTPLHCLCLLESQKVSVETKLELITSFRDLYDFTIRDNVGKTVIDYAQEHCPEILSILLNSEERRIEAPDEDLESVEIVDAMVGDGDVVSLVGEDLAA